jgi:RNA polymerase sigma-70 factor, ECF subfamily
MGTGVCLQAGGGAGNGRVAAAVQPVTITLQPGPNSPYHAVRRPVPLSAAVTMESPRVAKTPVPGDHAAAPPGPLGLESTFDLVERAKSGDGDALNQLFARYLPSLRRWASGRLPRWSRDLMDTDDLVQETVVRAVKRLDRFESRHEGALQAYLRQAVVNRIRDEIRRTKRSPGVAELDENASAHDASPLEEVIGVEALERYEAALARLRPEEREAIVARVELDGSYQQVAEALGKSSPDAARMAVSRALLRLAEEMSHEPS